MKQAIILLACLYCRLFATGQEPVQDAVGKMLLATPPSLPEYVYCEISGYKGAGRNGIYVGFDFGQPMTKKNRLIIDAEGRTITFNSCIDALNYMVCRGWEFVQAYAAGEDNDFSCMLLRMPTSKMSAAQRQVMLDAAMKTGE